MATYGANDALYGTGTFGTARFGRVTPVISVTGVSGTGQIEPPEVGGFEVDIGIRLTATTVGTGSVGSLQPNIKAEISGTTATVSLGQITIDAVSEISGVVGTGFVSPVGVSYAFTVTGVTSTTQVGTATKVNVSEIIVSSGMTLSLGSVTTTAVVFNFQAVRNDYSRRRTIYIAKAA